MRGTCRERNCLYFDFINVNILIVIFCLNFTGCYHWETLSKDTWDPSVLFLATVCESIIIFKVKSLINEDIQVPF